MVFNRRIKIKRTVRLGHWVRQYQKVCPPTPAITSNRVVNTSVDSHVTGVDRFFRMQVSAGQNGSLFTIFYQAVTRKFVHEDSGGVTALCGAVEACLGQGLRRRALGLFKTNSTTALLHKIAKVSL